MGDRERKKMKQLKEQQPKGGTRRSKPHSSRECRRRILRETSTITQRSPDQTEGKSEAHEGPVPLVVLPDGGHAHEDEDQGLADAAQHLHEILDGRVRLLRHVFFHILIHRHCASSDSARKDTASV